MVTLHLYTTPEVRHLPSKGQIAGSLQLQVGAFVLSELGWFSFRVFEDDIICARLGVVE